MTKIESEETSAAGCALIALALFRAQDLFGVWRLAFGFFPS
jgi:hypothetical protein